MNRREEKKMPTEEQARHAPAPKRTPPPIVGIGASAGGVSALQEFVEHIPEDSGIAWVLIQHMAPDRESELHSILGRKTKLPVAEVVKDTRAEADRIYIISPGRVMTVQDGVLRAVSGGDPLARRTSIDAFFLSLAADRGEHAGCALLSGAGSDGSLGLKAVKEAGGLTLTQTLGTAEYDSMLLSALRTGLVDREVGVDEMPGLFTDFLVRRQPIAREVAVQDGERLQICELLRRGVGHDFSGYKGSTVDRRIRRRMQMLGIATLTDYVERLKDDKREPFELFRDLLIGVTQFFRDPEAFAAVSDRVLTQILADKTADDEVRIWVPGCATGEEAYSLAMLLQEKASTLESMPELKIFGSDIDENALHVARLGRYPESIVADVTPERLKRFFDREDGTYVVRPQLREVCLFAQHNLLRDPPFSRIDLISCRNVLIYMDGPLQKRLMPVFHYALRPQGFLLLGPAENASSGGHLFQEIDRKHRIYRRVGESSRLPEFPIAQGDGEQTPRPSPGERREPPRASDQARRAAQRVLDRYMPAHVIVDSDFQILEASSGTGAYLELPRGRPDVNLAAMARSELAVDIKAAVSKVLTTGQRVTRSDLTVGSEDDRRRLTLTVEPLPGEDARERRCLVLFQAGPALTDTSESVRRPGGDLELIRALEQELQTTKERLQSTLEELETSNQELRASNEEFSSVNEELQSANEELETTKEELQSINEELRTVNNELSARVDDLSRANSDLKNLFSNTRIAMLFLDRNFRIRNFTPPAKPLFRLRDHDMGRPLDELAGRMDYEALKGEVREVIRAGELVEHEVEAPNEEGAQTFIMRILPYRGDNEKIEGAVLTFVDITERKRAEKRLADMVSELNHRVKNTLASVQSMVRQTRSRTRSKEEMAETLVGQLRAMSASHDILSQQEWQRVELAELVKTVLAPFADPQSRRLDLAGPAVELQPRVVVALGLILHELATNAGKYGAWSTPGGRVALHWDHVAGDPRTLGIEWIESGGPPVKAPERQGFGLTFISRCTDLELHGGFRPEFRPEGFRCLFELPEDVVLPARSRE